MTRSCELLIVDDEVDIVEELVDYLDSEGYVCHGAATPSAARELFQAYPEIGIVLVDLRMPAEDGLTLLRGLRDLAGDERYFEAIILTGHGSENNVIEAMRHGVGDYQKKPIDPRELLASLERAQKRLDEQVTLRSQALRDPLTGLFNRRYMEATLRREQARALREQRPLSLVVIDVDHFKQFNDRYGHPAGDAMLKALATILCSGSRLGDVACRYGGEEFLVVMPAATLSDATARVEQWREQFAGVRLPHERGLLQASFSAGIASYPDHGADEQEVLRAADEALYAAKAAGRNRTCQAAPRPAPASSA